MEERCLNKGCCSQGNFIRTTDMANRSYNNDQMTIRASFYAIFLCMLFGGNAVAIKFSLSGVGAFTAAGLRFGISAFVIYIWATFKKQPLRINKKQAMQLFILSQFFIMQSTFLYLGLTKTTASHGVLIINLLPFFVMVMAHFFIPGDHITLKKVLGLICGFWVSSSFFLITTDYHMI